jgi:hypothetical protein
MTTVRPKEFEITLAVGALQARNPATSYRPALPNWRALPIRKEQVDATTRDSVVGLTSLETLVEYVLPAEPPYGMRARIMRTASGWALGFFEDFHMYAMWQGVPTYRPGQIVELIDPGETKRCMRSRERTDPWFFQIDISGSIHKTGTGNPFPRRAQQLGLDAPIAVIRPILLLNSNIFTTVQVKTVDSSIDDVDSVLPVAAELAPGGGE